MSILPSSATALVQQVALPDTLITRVVAERGVFEYASGTLEIVVLFMAAVALGVFVWALFALRRVAVKAEHSMKALVDDVRPILRHASGVVADARETVGRLSADVERVTDTAANVTEQLLDGVEATARRIDEVNAVLDVLQDELENTAISSIAAIRGVRVGATEMASALGPRRPKRRRVNRLAQEDVDMRGLDREMPGEVEPG